MKRAFGLVFLLVFFFSLWAAGMDEAAADSLPEKLYALAKTPACGNHQERELLKRAAMRLQTLEAERAMRKEGRLNG